MNTEWQGPDTTLFQRNADPAQNSGKQGQKVPTKRHGAIRSMIAARTRKSAAKKEGERRHARRPPHASSEMGHTRRPPNVSRGGSRAQGVETVDAAIVSELAFCS